MIDVPKEIIQPYEYFTFEKNGDEYEKKTVRFTARYVLQEVTD